MRTAGEAGRCNTGSGNIVFFEDAVRVELVLGDAGRITGGSPGEGLGAATDRCCRSGSCGCGCAGVFGDIKGVRRVATGVGKGSLTATIREHRSVLRAVDQDIVVRIVLEVPNGVDCGGSGGGGFSPGLGVVTRGVPLTDTNVQELTVVPGGESSDGGDAHVRGGTRGSSVDVAVLTILVEADSSGDVDVISTDGVGWLVFVGANVRGTVDGITEDVGGEATDGDTIVDGGRQGREGEIAGRGGDEEGVNEFLVGGAFASAPIGICSVIPKVVISNKGWGSKNIPNSE